MEVSNDNLMMATQMFSFIMQLWDGWVAVISSLVNSFEIRLKVSSSLRSLKQVDKDPRGSWRKPASWG